MVFFGKRGLDQNKTTKTLLNGLFMGAYYDLVWCIGK